MKDRRCWAKKCWTESKDMTEIKKEELENLMKLKGKVRGVIFQTDKKYVLLKWGKEGLEKLEKKAEELGLNIPYETAETMAWYPIGQRVISLLLIKDVFDLDNQDIRRIGEMAPKFSFIVKFFFKLFTPLQKFAREIPGYWKKHYTVGVLEVKKVSEKEKTMVLLLKDIKAHPIFCKYLEGYFERVMKFIYPQSSCKETKCPFRGDDYHEYTFAW